MNWWEDLWLENGARVFLGSEQLALQLIDADESKLSDAQKETRKLLILRQEEFTKPKGLGDTIAAFTSRVGIRPCGGCRKRQQQLNEMFPYRRTE